jgi:hypothetical protein
MFSVLNLCNKLHVIGSATQFGDTHDISTHRQLPNLTRKLQAHQLGI